MITAEQVLNAPQTEAGKLLTQLGSDVDEERAIEVLRDLEDKEGRKHVRRSMDRVSRKLGYEDFDDLFNNTEPEPEEPPALGVDTSDLDLSTKDGWLAARERTLEAMKVDGVTVVVRDLSYAKCPRCGDESLGEEAVRADFGTRKMKAFNRRLGAHKVETRQSNCRKCRTAHAREMREKRKAEASDEG